MASKLQDYITKQRELERMKRELELLESDPAMQAEMAFKQELDALMTEYDKSPKDILELLKPNNEEQPKQDGRKKRRQKTYKNPHTGELLKTRGGNHKRLREWKDQHGEDTVESWLEHIE